MGDKTIQGKPKAQGDQSQGIQAIGRVLSETNTSQLREVFVMLGKVLTNAGLEHEVADAVREIGVKPRPLGEKVQAMKGAEFDSLLDPLTVADPEALAKSVKHQALYSEFHTLIDELKWRWDFAENLQQLQNLIAGFEQYLQEFARRYMQLLEINAGSSSSESEEEETAPEAQGDGKQVEQGQPPQQEEQAQEEQPPAELVNASSVQPLEINTHIQARSRDTGSNRHPISGVLFRIDEPSESAPAVGPGLPLYVPRDVAMKCLGQVSGLPLDSHDELDRHADENVTGVILDAKIDGNDFVVNGYLWDYNLNEKVSSISANRDTLGMSMNASAKGHEAEIDGRQVWQITDLTLLGANILFADRATWQKTRLITAEQEVANQEPPVLLAAGHSRSNSDNQSQQEDMTTSDIEQIENQFKAIQASLDHIVKLGEKVDSLSQQVSELTQERDQNLAAARAEAEKEEQQKSQQQLAETISSTVANEVSKQMQAMVNPNGNPPSGVVPLAAQGAPITGDREDIERQILVAENRLQTLVDHRVDTDERISLRDEIHRLKASLGRV